MEFTAQEMKLVERLRKLHRNWRWARWLLLAMGVGSAGLFVGYGYLLSTFFRGPPHPVDSDDLFGIAFFWTHCWMHMIFSIWCFVTVAGKWRGDATRTLLLRLLDTKTGNEHTA